MKKILFILKKRNIYSNNSYSNIDSGLYNSVIFVNEMLNKNNVDSKVIQVNDNNEIDKYCFQYKPNVVIIEALWVVPEKFEILQKLHPNITWIIRLHSELPFLANEGVAIDWIKGYTKYENVKIGSNSKYLIEALSPLLGRKILYLPNYYHVECFNHYDRIKNYESINVGVFGAIRPLKNTLTQAVAAMNYANSINKKLRLHINSSRVEQKGENVLKNLRALFKDTPHTLIEHGWLKHKDFTRLVSQMDICLQISLTETYNIVTADAINQNIPVVSTKEIPFVSCLSSVETNKDVEQIVESIEFNLNFSYITTKVNKFLLWFDSRKSKNSWLKFVKQK